MVTKNFLVINFVFRLSEVIQVCMDKLCFKDCQERSCGQKNSSVDKLAV
jgi:hypothetical protein